MKIQLCIEQWQMGTIHRNFPYKFITTPQYRSELNAYKEDNKFILFTNRVVVRTMSDYLNRLEKEYRNSKGYRE